MASRHPATVPEWFYLFLLVGPLGQQSEKGCEKIALSPFLVGQLSVDVASIGLEKFSKLMHQESLARCTDFDNLSQGQLFQQIICP